jgi:peptide/nickel transport system ATP-binding protein/oligopeptide transport system ATP-binding protein
MNGSSDNTIAVDQTNVLSVRDLSTTFLTRRGPSPAVRGVSFDVKQGQVLAIVGESGCGKSATAMSLMRLYGSRSARISGHVRLDGVDLATLSEKEMERVRGNRVAMIFQEPMTSLNPLMTIGYQLREPMRIHLQMDRNAAHRRGIELLDLVGIASAEQIMASHPHQLSGGMRQRAMIAIALSCDPQVLIADEPTTALDVTIQSQILHLLNEIRRRTNMAIIMITHDLGVVSEFADDVLVMYAGRAVESGKTADLLNRPLHPYTNGLLKSIPDLEARVARLNTIPGTVPDPLAPPPGCSFHPRCDRGIDACTKSVPRLASIEGGASDMEHAVACIRPVQMEGTSDVRATE